MPGEGFPSVGRYRVLHQIGTGSLGPVFRGEDPDTRDQVAIKYLRLKIGPERTRLIAEELLALVGRVPEHPALARVLHAGLEARELYIVTELAAGESLDVALREYGPATIADALPRLRRLAEALDLAAAHGVWHGELHPADIVVSARETRLTGLGVAPVLERARVGLEPRHPYTAPEVTEGHKSSPAADQYALATIAHEWLCGRPVAGAAESLVDVPPLAGVDGDALGGAFMWALAPNPADRFESCTAFVEALYSSAVGGGSLDAPIFATTGRDGPSDLPRPPEDSIADLLFDPEPQTAQQQLSSSPEPQAAASRADEGTVRWRGMLAAGGEAAESPGGLPLGTMVAVLIGGIALGVLGGYLLTDRLDAPGTPATVTQLRPQEPPDVAAAETRKGSAQPEGKGQPFTDAPVRPATEASTPQPPAVAAAQGSSVTPPVPPPTPARDSDAAPAARADTARLLVRSTPAGASVTIDGAGRGTTPLALRDLELGTRTLVISRPGYVAAERRITLTADRPSRSIEVALVPIAAATRPATPARAPATTNAAMGSLFVESRPAGASVTVDGRASGVTPLRLPIVAAGKHTVLIERAGYRPWTTTIDVKAGAPTRVAASLVGGQGQQ